MARNPRRRGRPRKIQIDKPEKKAAEPAAEKPAPPPDAPGRRPKREPGTETSPDTHLVNALESNPDFFKDPLIGRTVGKCRIEKLLGEGRTAVVYRAKYLPLKRTVAVKMLLPHMTRYPAVVRVFQQEGRAVAALDHENVLKIYDVGRDGEHHYLVLELLRGKPLLKLIEAAPDGQLDLADALEYTREAAAGLAAAHRKNLVHRDIKPENLVIEPDGTLKIVDFGLAAEAEGAFSGGRLGTPHYMSPEQCKGEQARTASDVYALGITLYHMLVGRPPYAGRKTTDEIIEDHLRAERLEPEKARTDIPRAVAELIRRMTRQNPEARPSAQDVRDLIETRLTPERLAGRGGPVRRGRRGRQATSSKGPLIVLGGVVVLAVVALLLFTGKGGPEEQETAGTTPERPEPPPSVDPTPEPDQPPRPRDLSDLEPWERELVSQLEEAKREERTGNFRVALDLFQRVIVKAPPESPWYREAKAAAQTLKDKLQVDAGVKDKPTRTYITVKESEEAGREFQEKLPELRRRLGLFKIGPVQADLEGLKERTREESTERRAIERELERLGIVRNLLGVVQGRAPFLEGDQAEWFTYDMNAEAGEIVVGAGEEGILLEDTHTKTTRTLAWEAVDVSARVDLIEACRLPTSATETVWLAFYCKLIDDQRAARYFDYALMLDDSAERRTEIKALREAD